MFEGTLIAESLRSGTTLDSVPLTVRAITRAAPGSTAPDQPPLWTLITFEITDSDADPLASALAASLARPGWYADFRSATQTYVVFSDRVFRYPRGDADGRLQAIAHGRTLAIPEPQLDWPVCTISAPPPCAASGEAHHDHGPTIVSVAALPDISPGQ